MQNSVSKQITVFYALNGTAMDAIKKISSLIFNSDFAPNQTAVKYYAGKSSSLQGMYVLMLAIIAYLSSWQVQNAAGASISQMTR